VSSKEVNQPVIDAVRQFHLRILVKKFTMSHSIERRGKVDSVNDYIRVGFQHSGDLVNNLVSAAVVEPVGRDANWSSKISPDGGHCSDG
jgi:hypothetical protein